MYFRALYHLVILIVCGCLKCGDAGLSNFAEEFKKQEKSNDFSGKHGMLFPRESPSRQIKDLGGLWSFRADTSQNRNAGFEEKWFLKYLVQTGPVIPMAVPASFNDITQDDSLRKFIGWVWYDRGFYPPSHWRSENLRVVLRFESAHYNTIVWVNGQQAMSHSGGHLPFEAEVNKYLLFNEYNRITVAVNNTLNATTLPPGKIEYLTGPRYPAGYFIQTYEFDFFNYAGIHRPVRFYTTPQVYISDISVIPSFVSSDNNNISGKLEFKTVVISPVQYRSSLVIKYELFDKQCNVVARASGLGLLSGALLVDAVKPWWPIGMSDSPGYLYNLMVTVSGNGFLDVYNLPVGFRTVKVDETQFLVNDKPFYFKGFNMHEDSDIRGKGLDFPLILKNFNIFTWLGGNAFRTSHYPYAEEIMDLADQLGIVVIDECPGVGIRKPNFGPKSLSHHLAVMEELVRRDKNRPSVVMWSVANEPSSNEPEAEAYFRTVINHTRFLDPTRPVTFVGNQSPTTDRAYPPVMFTEDYQVGTIEQYFPVFDKLRKEFLVGELIWNFADFMTQQDVKRVKGNRKGILTRDRQPKHAAYALRNRYLNISMAVDSPLLT
ncbi:beta-glucuronidase-like isoform X2 [Dendronephthya gigantea]|uniref:beta-glucuronidase-like isoform X2 n=1 Tax=Dendronephthya gigantea TaxID=151771 RepID=UPI00106BCB90|nr:beta-glucuronidase-like isoform X2 [Dendronephthya gigantea]